MCLVLQIILLKISHYLVHHRFMYHWNERVKLKGNISCRAWEPCLLLSHEVLFTTGLSLENGFDSGGGSSVCFPGVSSPTGTNDLLFPGSVCPPWRLIDENYSPRRQTLNDVSRVSRRFVVGDAGWGGWEGESSGEADSVRCNIKLLSSESFQTNSQKRIHFLKETCLCRDSTFKFCFSAFCM